MDEARIADLSHPTLPPEWRAVPRGRDSLTLPGIRYTSPEFAKLEWEHVFSNTWLLLGREDEVPEPGDFSVENFGPESFLYARQKDGSIKVFYNVCQHRGNRLMYSEIGTVDAFRCAYHGWRFDLDGKLLWAQDPADFPGGSPCSHLRLVEVRHESFCGFIWINMDPNACSLKEYLGPIYDQWLAYPIDEMKRYLALSVRLPCNWKVVQDNFRESYHLPATHPQSAMVLEDGYEDTEFYEYEEGHGLMKMKAGMPSRRLEAEHIPLMGEMLSDMLRGWDLNPQDFVGREFEARKALQQQMRKIGPSRGYTHLDKLTDDQLTDFYHYNLFPNFSVSIVFDGFHYLRAKPHATDPNKCELDNWYYSLSPAGLTTPVRTPNGPVARDAVVEHESFDYLTKSAGFFIDQDLSNMLGQQQGFRSKGYRGALLAGQEGRIAQYHAMIDDYIEGRLPKRG